MKLLTRDEVNLGVSILDTEICKINRHILSQHSPGYDGNHCHHVLNSEDFAKDPDTLQKLSLRDHIRFTEEQCQEYLKPEALFILSELKKAGYQHVSIGLDQDEDDKFLVILICW